MDRNSEVLEVGRANMEVRVVEGSGIAVGTLRLDFRFLEEVLT